MNYFKNQVLNEELEQQQQQQQQQTQTEQVLLKDYEINEKDLQLVSSLVIQLTKNNSEQALIQLNELKEEIDLIAPVVWYATGCVALLLREITSVYPLLSPPSLSQKRSEKVCHALGLFQSVASHKETHTLFLRSNIPLYLYPFLSSSSKSLPFTQLRINSLGVIASFVKTQEDSVINFLLTTEIIPLCLHIMEICTEQEKIIATFIILKIILNENGLTYICDIYQRFLAVSSVIGNMVNYLLEEPSVKLLENIIRCYSRLADNSRAREALKQTLPQPLKDGTFNEQIRNHQNIQESLNSLLSELDL
ncbi:ccr4-not transcription complex subunit 9 [Anaeramoeba flamelloides]|uniref:Ccr4-not transcription complex subunit 9 n=1 Tax=Anaeramoeba flamelloides TaxID=1746091 RepID=A0ABQ8XNA5_9EUKA|nr:ccr4-not transcription complex subunit 9 [Anaeramoeba flamelloides]